MSMHTRTLVLGVGAIIILALGAYLILSPSPDAPSDTQVSEPAIGESPQIQSNSEIETDPSEVSPPPVVTQEAVPPAQPEVQPTTPATPAKQPELNPTPVAAQPHTTPVASPPPPASVEEPVVPPQTYTLADIQKHASAESCWSIINGKVYDLTTFVTKHPGGEKNILKLCGKDGTALFENQHGGESKPATRLSSLFVAEAQ